MKREFAASLTTAHAIERRAFIRRALQGSVIVAVGGGLYTFSDELTRRARAESRPDGRSRVPPGQRVLRALKPMGGEPGEPRTSSFRLRIHGDVEQPFELDFAGLLALPQLDRKVDVHCVTGWSVLDLGVRGVALRELAARAKVRDGARYVIFEAAHGYTANVPLAIALRPDVMIAHRIADAPLGRAHGAPARAIVPDLYFWKSAKWITGVRFVRRDQPGYWETRGYHNRGDPWLEERYG